MTRLPGLGASRGRHAAVSRRKAASAPWRGEASLHLTSVTTWPRALSCALLCSGLVGVVLFQYQLRRLEAETAAAIYGLVTPTLTAARSPVVWFGLGSPRSFGLMITPDCCSALLLVPLLALGMALVLPVRLELRRVMSALAVAAIVLVAGNLLRIGAIAAAVTLAGPGLGYEVGHLVIGSAMSVVFIGASLILMTLIITSARPS